MNWKELSFWKSGEYQVVEEKLADLTKAKTHWCPGKKNLFKALDLVPFDKVKVVIVGQDPYPDPAYATGVAFSVPEDAPSFPPTLVSILNEYSSDLGLPFPSKGNLESWCSQGVLLWNVIPSCTAFSSLSHSWEEWKLLTKEIVEKLSNTEEYIVFVFLGGVAREFAQYVNKDNCDVIETSHPSPRGSLSSRTPFKGSRIFSRVNDLLCSHCQPAISWKLP